MLGDRANHLVDGSFCYNINFIVSALLYFVSQVRFKHRILLLGLATRRIFKSKSCIIMKISSAMSFALAVLIMLLVSFNDASANETDVSEDTSDSIWHQTYKTVLQCSQKPSILVCLKMKAVKYLDRALHNKEAIHLMDYLSFAKDPNVKEENVDVISEADLENSLPRSLDEQDGRLDQILDDKLSSFFGSRSLQLTLPLNMGEEGRGKKYKYGALMLAGLGVAGMMVQLMMGKIALIAGKALMVAKVALVLSMVVGIKKLFGKGDGGGEVIYSQGDHGGGGWSHRSSKNAHNLAYSSYLPTADIDAHYRDKN